jgi:hypothetical protein
MLKLPTDLNFDDTFVGVTSMREHRFDVVFTDLTEFIYQSRSGYLDLMTLTATATRQNG